MNTKNPDDGKHNGQRSTDNSERYFSVANNPINSINPNNSINPIDPLRELRALRGKKIICVHDCPARGGVKLRPVKKLCVLGYKNYNLMSPDTPEGRREE